MAPRKLTQSIKAQRPDRLTQHPDDVRQDATAARLERMKRGVSGIEYPERVYDACVNETGYSHQASYSRYTPPSLIQWCPQRKRYIGAPIGIGKVSVTPPPVTPPSNLVKRDDRDLLRRRKGYTNTNTGGSV